MQLPAVNIEAHESIPTVPAAQPLVLVDAAAQHAVGSAGLGGSEPTAQWLGQSGCWCFRGWQRSDRKLADLALAA